MSKKCERCNVDIPDDFQNLLCVSCYLKTEQEAEEDRKRIKDEEVVKKEKLEKQFDLDTKPIKPISDLEIKNPDYKPNPEQEDKEQIYTNLNLFVKHGVLLWHPTRAMYNFIKNWCMTKVLSHPQYPKYIWKPKIVDVGCGSGTGSNILSQEADFVWGIDKNQLSVNFAKEAFTRVKNGIYYSSQISFDHVDITEDTREFMKFDVVVAIEIIEHIADWTKFMKGLLKFAKMDKNGKPFREDPTVYFISTPNRNHKSIMPDGPKNKFHVKEATQEEFVEFLSQYFENVEILNSNGEPVGDRTDHTPILAKCSIPRV